MGAKLVSNFRAPDRGEYSQAAGTIYDFNYVKKIIAKLITSDNHPGCD
jgi:hypothetical protein